MLFLTSELANKAEITILSARDTARAWVPGWGIMGRSAGVYKTGYSTWLSSRLQNQPRSFLLFRLIFFPLPCVMSVTKDEVSDLIKANNNQLMASFKELLKDTASQIKRANETSTEQQMKEIKKLKFQEPHKFKRKASEDQYKFNLKVAETFDSA